MARAGTNFAANSRCAGLGRVCPARAHWVALAGADDLPLVVVRRVGDAVDDLEFASRTRGRRLADGDAIEADDPSVFKQRQLAVGNANQNPLHARLSGWPPR